MLINPTDPTVVSITTGVLRFSPESQTKIYISKPFKAPFFGSAPGPQQIAPSPRCEKCTSDKFSACGTRASRGQKINFF